MTELTEALALSSLVGGTLEYAILIRHREERRQAERTQSEVEAAGRDALVRAHLLDGRAAGRRWVAYGTRFR